MLKTSPLGYDASRGEKRGHKKSHGYEWVSASHAAVADRHAAHGGHGASGFPGHSPQRPHHVNGTRATSRNWVISDHISLHPLLQQIKTNYLSLHMYSWHRTKCSYWSMHHNWALQRSQKKQCSLSWSRYRRTKHPRNHQHSRTPRTHRTAAHRTCCSPSMNCANAGEMHPSAQMSCA